MKKIPYKEIAIKSSNFNFSRLLKKYNSPNSNLYFTICICLFIFIILILIINDIVLIKIIKKNSINLENKKEVHVNHTNINFEDEFFRINEVKQQIEAKHLINIDTITCDGKINIGNSLIQLNNLINICVSIHCKNIISPKGLENIIKNPIVNQKYNITILPNIYEKSMNIDIKLGFVIAYFFHYWKKFHEMRLNIIKEEVFKNIPKYNANPDDIYFNIRSGDIFSNMINRNYGQPPLCFYQKIIDKKKYKNYYILSNGHENPVVDELIKKYPIIGYIHGSVEYDISVLVNAYNLALPVSTFPLTLIRLNSNLKNVYIYDIIDYNLRDANYTIFRMIPTKNYIEKIKRKWKNSKEQLDLMITENCTNNELLPYMFENKNKRFVDF